MNGINGWSIARSKNIFHEIPRFFSKSTKKTKFSKISNNVTRRNCRSKIVLQVHMEGQGDT